MGASRRKSFILAIPRNYSVTIVLGMGSNLKSGQLLLGGFIGQDVIGVFIISDLFDDAAGLKAIQKPSCGASGDLEGRFHLDPCDLSPRFDQLKG